MHARREDTDATGNTQSQAPTQASSSPPSLESSGGEPTPLKPTPRGFECTVGGVGAGVGGAGAPSPRDPVGL